MRIRTILNRDWRFTLGDPQGAELVDHDDSGWEPIGLPHSFSIPYFQATDFYTGPGWYRRHLVLTGTEGSLRLEFEGGPWVSSPDTVGCTPHICKGNRVEVCVLFDVFPALGPPDDGTHRNDEHIHQEMAAIRCLGTTGISQRGKMLLKRARRTHTHREFSSSAKDFGR